MTDRAKLVRMIMIIWSSTWSVTRELQIMKMFSVNMPNVCPKRSWPSWFMKETGRKTSEISFQAMCFPHFPLSQKIHTQVIAVLVQHTPMFVLRKQKSSGFHTPINHNDHSLWQQKKLCNQSCAIFTLPFFFFFVVSIQLNCTVSSTCCWAYAANLSSELAVNSCAAGTRSNWNDTVVVSNGSVNFYSWQELKAGVCLPVSVCSPPFLVLSCVWNAHSTKFLWYPNSLPPPELFLAWGYCLRLHDATGRCKNDAAHFLRLQLRAHRVGTLRAVRQLQSESGGTNGWSRKRAQLQIWLRP